MCYYFGKTKEVSLAREQYGSEEQPAGREEGRAQEKRDAEGWQPEAGPGR